MGEYSICNAAKLLSVEACEKYMTAFSFYILFMLESMMASGKRGHSEQCTTMESQCIASLIFHFYDDISIALLCSARRKTIISNWVSIMYFWALCVSERIYVRWEKFLISAGKRWKTKQKNPNNNWLNSNYYFLLPLCCSTELLETVIWTKLFI